MYNVHCAMCILPTPIGFGATRGGDTFFAPLPSPFGPPPSMATLIMIFGTNNQKLCLLRTKNLFLKRVLAVEPDEKICVAKTHQV